MGALLQILYVGFFGIPIAVFIISSIKGTTREESIKKAYIAAILLILLGVAYLFLINASIEEVTKNQYVYIGLMLAFMGLMLAVQGDIKETQRHRDIQEKIDQTHDRLDQIENCLKDTIDPKNNDRPKISKEIQKDTENLTSNLKVENLPASESPEDPHEKNKTTSVIFGRELTDEDKIIFEHLSKRHEDLLSFADALDSKLAQIIALNGLILSFVFYRGNEAAMPPVFIFGLGVIVISIIIGVYGYHSTKFSAGLSGNFFREYKGFDSGKGLSILYDRLVKGIEKNTKTQSIKARFFNYMLILNIIGLTILLVGYYA